MFPYKTTLPCCGKSITLQRKSGTGLDSPNYWKRTCTNIMCQQVWHINLNPDRTFTGTKGTQPKAFTL